MHHWYCIALTSDNNTVQKHNNKEQSETIRNLTMPCINLSEYWTSVWVEAVLHVQSSWLVLYKKCLHFLLWPGTRKGQCGCHNGFYGPWTTEGNYHTGRKFNCLTSKSAKIQIQEQFWGPLWIWSFSVPTTMFMLPVTTVRHFERTARVNCIVPAIVVHYRPGRLIFCNY